MFKDYYKILAVSPTATPQEIKSAYRTMSIKWHPDKNPGQDVTSIMQDINEAYAILKDVDKRSRYDVEYNNFTQYSYRQRQQSNSQPSTQSYSAWEYDYDVQNEDVREDISNARKYAEEIVAKFMASFKQAAHDAASGAWDGAKGYVWVAVSIIVIGVMMQLYFYTTQLSHVSDYTSRDIEMIPRDVSEISNDYSAKETLEGWTRYWINNSAFSIAVPQTVELRNSNDQYTKRLRNKGLAVNTDNIVFQQKGLANSVAGTEDKHYCRIIINYVKCQPGDVYSHNETELITDDLKSELFELVSAELAPSQNFVEEPAFKWIDISGQKAIEIKYKRTGNKGNITCCTMYLLFNYDELVKMIVAYREQEAELWASDMNMIIKTFKWN